MSNPENDDNLATPDDDLDDLASRDPAVSSEAVTEPEPVDSEVDPDDDVTPGDDQPGEDPPAEPGTEG